MKQLLFLSMFFFQLYADRAVSNLQCYILANYYQFGNDLKNAGYWYSQITPTADTNSHYIYLGYIPYLAAIQSYSEIVKLLPDFDAVYKSNLEIQQLFALALEKVGKKNEAHARLITLQEQNKSHQELAFKVAQIYVERSEPENAIQVIDTLLNNCSRRPNNYIFYFIKAQLLVQLNKKHDALETITQCIALHPRFDKSWLLYAVLHEQAGKINEAIQGYKSFLETTTESHKEIERHLASLAFVDQRTALKTSTSSDPKECLAQAISLFEKKDFTKALQHTDQCLAQSPEDAQARLLKIQILASQQRLEPALDLLTQWILTAKSPDLWLKTLHLLCYCGLPYKKALQALQYIEKKKGAWDQLLLYQADLAVRDANLALALSVLAKAEKLITDPAVKSHIALQKAHIYYDQSQWQDAITTLEQSLALFSYAPAHNLLAYLYATKGKNHVKAKETIELALKSDPENPHFLDTKALVLYKQKDYREAIVLLQKAAAACPTDSTILHHLGKCYLRNGQMELAAQSGKAAMAVAKTEIEKRKAKSLIAKASG